MWTSNHTPWDLPSSSINHRSCGHDKAHMFCSVFLHTGPHSHFLPIKYPSNHRRKSALTHDHLSSCSRTIRTVYARVVPCLIYEVASYVTVEEKALYSNHFIRDTANTASNYSVSVYKKYNYMICKYIWTQLYPTIHVSYKIQFTVKCTVIQTGIIYSFNNLSKYYKSNIPLKTL